MSLQVGPDENQVRPLKMACPGPSALSPCYGNSHLKGNLVLKVGVLLLGRRNHRQSLVPGLLSVRS